MVNFWIQFAISPTCWDETWLMNELNANTANQVFIFQNSVSVNSGTSAKQREWKCSGCIMYFVTCKESWYSPKKSSLFLLWIVNTKTILPHSQNKKNASLAAQKISIKDFFKETAEVVTFTEEILNGKLHFVCSFPTIMTISIP